MAYLPNGHPDSGTTNKQSLSSSEILALNSTPITLVAAPGSGKAVQVLAISMKHNFSGSAYVVAGVLEIKHAGGTNLVPPSTSLLLATSTKTF